jgi:peptidoglycan/LPS O-acetylase OafA/YrhL
MASHFRFEIAGLRAVAVIAVVLFHLKIDGFQGGFVGVDVFFVISGYLISRNILLDLQAGRFSLGQFYIRRTRRIYPALIFTVMATYLLGALWCSPEMFLDLAKEATHALLSISNIQYWRESHRYFAANSDELALLHCWSLSVEEQFYLVWPAFIILARKSGHTFAVIAIAALVSLLSSIVVAKSDPLAAFFLMPFRIFEFAVGALVLRLETGFRLSAVAAEGLSAAGILCIVASALLFDSEMPHLEAAVLLPCLGAAGTIWAGDKTRASKIVSNPAMVALGAISYSLYLCHWPIIFFGRFIFGDAAASSLGGILIMLAVMIAVATAMYQFVERRFIQPPGARSTSFPRYAAVFWSVLLPLAAITHLTFLSGGLPWRLPEAKTELAHLQDFPSNPDFQTVDGPVGFELVGDSLLAEYLYGLLPIMRQLGMEAHASGGAGCPILYGATLKWARREECRLARDQALDQLSRNDLPVIFVEKWSLYDDASIDDESDTAGNLPTGKGSFTKLQLAVERTMEKLIARGHRILIIGEQPDPSCAVNRPRLLQGPLPHAPLPCPAITRQAAKQSTERIDRMLGRVQARWPDKIELLRPLDYFCDTECPAVKGGLWLYASRIHLTLAGSNLMVSRAADVFHRFLAPR